VFQSVIVNVVILLWVAIVGDLLVPAVACAADAAEPIPARSQPVRLTIDGRLKMDPVFISGGTELVFTVLEKADQTSLIKLRLADGAQERFNPKATTSEFEAAFSRDGRYCSYVQNRGNLSLRLVIRDLLNKTESIFDPGGGFAGMRHPTFALDSSGLVVSNPGSGGQQLLAIGLDGRRGKELTQGESLNCWPAFSPNGKQIAFGSSRGGDFDLYLMDADGSNVSRIVASPGRDMRPAWSPDGRRLAFTSARDGNPEIYVINVDGSGLVRLTENPEQDDFAAWHPDGRRLAFMSERAGKFDLYLSDVPVD
jgi:Tol biopolymer transport system component